MKIYYGILLNFILILKANAYKNGEEVIIYVNKVGPYSNPHETYHYYKLPVCRPDIIEHKSLSLGEVLDGDRMAKSLYKIHFLERVSDEPLCELVLSEDEVTYLRHAIEEDYYYEFIIDDIPVRDFIGHFEESGIVAHTHNIFLWTHQSFHIYYNRRNIIFANISVGHKPISIDSLAYPFHYTPTYSVKWIPTDVKYSHRDQLLKSTSFFPQNLEIHWLSVINSCVLVFLLIGSVLVILTRILNNDFARYNINDRKMEVLDDEYGWKVIHTDVFRIPNHVNLLSAILGVGSQFLCIFCGLIAMALLGLFNVHRHGSMYSMGIGLYALTSFISGYVSATMYVKSGQKNWIKNAHLTTVVFAGPLFFIWSVQNTIAWIYHSTQALPATTVILLFFFWLCIGYPLTIIGSIMGKNSKGNFSFPCKAKNFPREIPSAPWYRTAIPQCIIGGFLPFSSVSVEMYYIYATLWDREQYTLFGILALIFVIILSVTVCVSVALTYFQLSVEDYRWWWRSIFSCGSTSIFVLLYSIFYFSQRSNMTGIIQVTQYFGWSVLAAYCFFLTLGTLSFFSSFVFVKYIYQNVKIE